MGGVPCGLRSLGAEQTLAAHVLWKKCSCLQETRNKPSLHTLFTTEILAVHCWEGHAGRQAAPPTTAATTTWHTHGCLHLAAAASTSGMLDECVSG